MTSSGIQLHKEKDRHFVTALARGLEVLACFRSGNKVLSNQEIAKRCSLPRSTVSRLTATLTRLGYLAPDEDSGKYRLGVATLALGVGMLAKLDIRQVARPWMQELADFSQGMVTLGVRDRLSMLYIENSRSKAALTLSMDVGSRIPIATSAMGRAYLAEAGEAERLEVIERVRELEEPASQTIISGIDQALLDYQRLGCTCSFGDWNKHVNGIAVGVNLGTSFPVMAINCGGPSSQLPAAFLLDEVRPRLLDLVRKLKATVGGP
ncbi:IclR family transcriptional regulator [Alcaligenaceae bacterium]|nr:IclR family transcriptional regulator [Alcaligenaceae bacterium]